MVTICYAYSSSPSITHTLVEFHSSISLALRLLSPAEGMVFLHHWYLSQGLSRTQILDTLPIFITTSLAILCRAQLCGTGAAVLPQLWQRASRHPPRWRRVSLLRQLRRLQVQLLRQIPAQGLHNYMNNAGDRDGRVQHYVQPEHARLAICITVSAFHRSILMILFGNWRSVLSEELCI